MKAIILNATAWMIVPVMDAIAKHLSLTMDVFQITWARYFFTVVFTLSLMVLFSRETLVWSKRPKLQLVRGIILAFSTLCFFYSICPVLLLVSLPRWTQTNQNDLFPRALNAAPRHWRDCFPILFHRLQRGSLQELYIPHQPTCSGFCFSKKP